MARHPTLPPTYSRNPHGLRKFTAIPPLRNPRCHPSYWSLDLTLLFFHCSYPLLKDGWNFHLTPSLQSSIDAFTSWYTTQHKNRVLSWRFQLATVTLTARFASGRYEIGVSLFQAVVLLLFNEVGSLTFAEIKERTGIGTLLYSLMCYQDLS